MTDEEKLQRRWERSHEISPGRADQDPARPVDALDYLIRYLSDSLEPTSGKNRVPALNRKFLKTFGEDCDHILETLGFTKVSEAVGEEDDDSVLVWYLPNTNPDGDDHKVDLSRIQDAIHELKALLNTYPMAERTKMKSPQPVLKPALPSIQNLLGFPAVDYSAMLTPLARNSRREESKQEEHPYYASLGAVSELGDELIFYAYEAQCTSDPANKAYYLECLKDIAMTRNSEKLTTEFQLLASRGHRTSGEIAAACREFGLTPRKMWELSDDDILGNFESRLQDSGSEAKAKLRAALDVLGTERDSGKLISAAAQRLESYEDALRFLGMDETHDDEWVRTLYNQKCEDPANSENAKKAVRLIAQHRNNSGILRCLDDEEFGSREMDVSEAYALLGVKDRSQAPDMDVLETQRVTLAMDNPANAEKLQKAFDLVREDVTRKQFSANVQQQCGVTLRPSHSLETWPVGCRNLGNTCYLNSVLQFLFTIKPLRERVLNCDQYFQQLSEEALKDKRVGSKVTADMVEHGQKCEYPPRCRTPNR